MIPRFVTVDSEELMEIAESTRHKEMKAQASKARLYLAAVGDVHISLEDREKLAAAITIQLEMSTEFPVAYVDLIFRLFPYAEYVCESRDDPEKAVYVFLDCLSTLLCNSTFSPAEDFLEVLHSQMKAVLGDPSKDTI